MPRRRRATGLSGGRFPPYARGICAGLCRAIIAVVMPCSAWRRLLPSGAPGRGRSVSSRQLEFDLLDEVAKAGLTGIAPWYWAHASVKRRCAIWRGLLPAMPRRRQLGTCVARRNAGDAQQQYFRIDTEPGNPDHAFNLAVSLSIWISQNWPSTITRRRRRWLRSASRHLILPSSKSYRGPSQP